jgi:hypothetical protein
MYKPPIEEICQRVDTAIGILFKNDIYLLKIGVHERTVSHKLAEYLQAQFPDWNVDCEYNRKGGVVQKLLTRECSKKPKVYPDIIIHQRGTTNNLLVIEMKTSDLPIECDIEKLILFTSKPEFNYSYGLFIKFNKTNDHEMKWYSEGQEKFPES